VSPLEQIALQPAYRTGRHNLVSEFYEPCLKAARTYDRAVGYFTSASLSLAARGVASLIHRNGKMRLIASPALEEQDIQALERGTERPEELLRQVAARSLTDVQDLLTKERLNALAWLIAKDSLEVRLAIRLDSRSEISSGIYHEKLGIFSDGNNQVAFSGSANETAGGLVNNFESIDAFWSWDDAQGRVQRKVDDFEDLWNNSTKGVRVIEFTQASKELLKKYKLPNPPPEGDRKPSGPFSSLRPARDYQDDALDAWFAAECKGVLAMATGSGKTLTALHALNRLSCRGPLVAIITCPYTNLAEQWIRELKQAGIDRPLRCFGARDTWLEELASGISALLMGSRRLVVAVVVNKTFATPSFQACLQPKRIDHIIIADEMHNLGADNIRTYLNDDIQFRLGLSATPERHMDEEGTQALFEYFGKIVYTYSLKQAIADNNLCPYYYHPTLVDLTDDEADEYRQITIQIGKQLGRPIKANNDNVRLKMLLLQRSRLLAGAKNKLPLLHRDLEAIQKKGGRVSRALFYCGDGRVDDNEDPDQTIRQLDATLKLLGHDAHLHVRKFTAEERPEEREELLRQMKADQLDALVAIRCLDEGIDLPDIRMGFILASSTNPRQFIQRRGRLLRKAEGKQSAEIWDYVVKPPDLSDLVEDDVFNIERKLFLRELRRVVDFCATAINGDAAEGRLLDLRRRYNLLANE